MVVAVGDASVMVHDYLQKNNAKMKEFVKESLSLRFIDIIGI